MTSKLYGDSDSSSEVIAGGKTITYEQLAAAPEKPPANPAPEISPELAAQFQRWATKENLHVSFSATVYQHQVTVLRWSWEGRRYKAYSRMDWNLLSGPGFVETSERVYHHVLGLGNLDDAVENLGLEMPQEDGQYIVGVADGSTDPVPSDVTQILDDLHAHYLANKAALLAAHAAREAAAEASRASIGQPEPPKDTVIQFWPKRSAQTPVQETNGGQR